MSFALAAVLGIGALSTGYEYSMAKARAKAAEQAQVYNNKMARISNAMNQNAITTNVSQAIRMSARQAGQIQQQGQALASAVSTQAAATSTVGNSVQQSVLAARQSEASAEYSRQEALQASFVAADYQRMNSAMAANMAQDYSPIEKPNAGMYAMKMIGGGLFTANQWQDSLGTTTNPTPYGGANSQANPIVGQAFSSSIPSFTYNGSLARSMGSNLFANTFDLF